MTAKSTAAVRAHRERKRLAMTAEMQRLDAEDARRAAAFEAIATYRTEKAKSDERNAAKREAISASIKAALAKADEDKRHAFRVGRPKRLPDMCLTSDKANALVNALASWHE